jgi:hypothetical protein
MPCSGEARSDNDILVLRVLPGHELLRDTIHSASQRRDAAEQSSHPVEEIEVLLPDAGSGECDVACLTDIR